MGSEVAGAEIGFDLDDAPGEEMGAVAANEDFAEKVARGAPGIAGEEGARNSLQV
jgi:hypothetical protein